MKCSCHECSWDGPEHEGEHVNGVFHCPIHRAQALREETINGLPVLRVDGDGRPTDLKWLNRFARLVADQEAAKDSGLSKGKIEQRAHRFSFQDKVVTFLIERHPVYATTEQMWRFDVDRVRLTLVEQKVLRSPFDHDADEDSYACPNCGEVLDCSPGIARCPYCGHERRHEHTPDW